MQWSGFDAVHSCWKMKNPISELTQSTAESAEVCVLSDWALSRTENSKILGLDVILLIEGILNLKSFTILGIFLNPIVKLH